MRAHVIFYACIGDTDVAKCVLAWSKSSGSGVKWQSFSVTAVPAKVVEFTGEEPVIEVKNRVEITVVVDCGAKDIGGALELLQNLALHLKVFYYLDLVPYHSQTC